MPVLHVVPDQEVPVQGVYSHAPSTNSSPVQVRPFHVPPSHVDPAEEAATQAAASQGWPWASTSPSRTVPVSGSTTPAPPRAASREPRPLENGWSAPVVGRARGRHGGQDVGDAGAHGGLVTGQGLCGVHQQGLDLVGGQLGARLQQQRHLAGDEGGGLRGPAAPEEATAQVSFDPALGAGDVGVGARHPQGDD